MRVTVLGKSPSWQDADGACSGYLVQDERTCALVDCGSGVFAKLRGVCNYAAVDVVVVSHMHADHFIDLVPYACALTYGPRGSSRQPQLLLPPDGTEALRMLARGGGHEELMDGAFAISEYDPAQRVAVNTLSFGFAPVPHFIPCNAVQVSSTEGEGRFTYGADHRFTDALDAFAADTDLLILEATLPEPDPDSSRGHMTAAEAGEVATQCNARRLVLTHISDECERDHALAGAQRTYSGPVEVAHGGAVYDV
ncbi:MAG: MBL fold metallo-hydrolase [Actinomycetota bacterium]|nr:MBL fold metallo-hydrolase [Actinomycetota bacterium]